MQKNNVVTVTIEDIGVNGEGIGKVDGLCRKGWNDRDPSVSAKMYFLRDNRECNVDERQRDLPGMYGRDQGGIP